RNRLWATSAAYMNDRDEIVAGREALRNAIEAHQPPIEDWQRDQLTRSGVMGDGNAHNLFILCASRDDDSLNTWRSYGVRSAAEYAIVLDRGVELLAVQQDDSDMHPEPPPPGWGDDAIEVTPDGERIRAYDPDEGWALAREWGDVEYLTPDNTAAVSREVESL